MTGSKAFLRRKKEYQERIVDNFVQRIVIHTMPNRKNRHHAQH